MQACKHINKGNIQQRQAGSKAAIQTDREMAYINTYMHTEREADIQGGINTNGQPNIHTNNTQANTDIQAGIQGGRGRRTGK